MHYDELIVLAVGVFEVFACIREAVEHCLVHIHHEGLVRRAELNLLIGELFVEIGHIKAVANSRLEGRLNLLVGYLIPVDVPEKEVLSNFRLAAASVFVFVAQ